MMWDDRRIFEISRHVAMSTTIQVGKSTCRIIGLQLWFRGQLRVCASASGGPNVGGRDVQSCDCASVCAVTTSHSAWVDRMSGKGRTSLAYGQQKARTHCLRQQRGGRAVRLPIMIAMPSATNARTAGTARTQSIENAWGCSAAMKLSSIAAINHHDGMSRRSVGNIGEVIAVERSYTHAVPSTLRSAKMSGVA